VPLGFQVGNKTFKVHLDGYNLMPFFKGEVKESPRKGFLYWSDDGDIFALRIGRWKTVFIEQNHEGLDIWRLGFEKLRVPKLFDLLADPFERGDSSMALRPMVHTPCVHELRGCSIGRGVAPELQRIPAETETGEF
jgi:hypothetical protein